MLRAFIGITILTLSCVGVGRFALAQEQFSTIPTARMLPKGYMSLKIETLDPYLQTSIGAQFLDPLYVQLKQAAETSGLNTSPDSLSPGLDLKLRLINENRFLPETVLGLNNAIGHSRLASEYLVASKRFYSFDFSGGVAWGKLGSAAHTNNPLKFLSSRFEKARPVNDEDDNSPAHWFTGPDVGFFAGVSYQTPLDFLQLNLDWNADRYHIEQNLIQDFNTPDPWSIGATLQFKDKMSFHGAFVGGEKLLGRVSFTPYLEKTKTHNWRRSLPVQIKQRQTSDIASSYMGLNGKRLTLPQRQVLSSTSTPSELWQDLETRNTSPEFYFKTNTLFKPRHLRIHQESNFALLEKANGILTRNSILMNNVNETAGGLLVGFGLRANLGNDLSRNVQTSNTPETRRDTVRFADKVIGLDRAYLAKNYSYNDIHTQLSGGYLEEMYAGYGGQILYRPYGRTYAFGLEAWDVVRRDHDSNLNTRVLSDRADWTGHLNAYYEFPNTNTTLHTKFGRYLAGDYGATMALSHAYKNGIKMKGYVTYTDEKHIDLLNGESNTLAGLNLSIPLQFKRVPKVLDKFCCDIDLNFESFTRDNGQSLNHPMPLYELSEPLSYRSLAQNWDDIR